MPYCGFGKKDPQSNLEKMFLQLKRGVVPTTKETDVRSMVFVNGDVAEVTGKDGFQ